MSDGGTTLDGVSAKFHALYTPFPVIGDAENIAYPVPSAFRRCPPCSIPICKYEADAHPVHTVVVIHKALAISDIVLEIATDPF